MERIKKYNQILLAIAGTLGLIFLLIIGIFMIRDMIRYSNYPEEDFFEPGLISEEITDSLIVKKKREQILTFNQFHLLDSAKNIFIIPVSQRNLDEPESSDDLLGLTNSYTVEYSPNRRKSGVIYNNLLLYNSFKKESIVLFDNRISISNYIYLASCSCIVIRATNEDTNNDNYIDNLDLQQLYIYKIEEKKLIKIKTKENYDFINFANGIPREEMVLQFGMDRNKNGEFERRIEPKFYLELDLNKYKLVPIISEKQINQIQNLLEGNLN